MVEEQIKDLLSETGIQYEYMEFEVGTISPPYIVWYLDESRGFYADGINYLNVHSVAIELYTDEYDRALEERIETVLRKHDIGFKAQRTYLNDENMYETIYLVEVAIDEQQN